MRDSISSPTVISSSIAACLRRLWRSLRILATRRVSPLGTSPDLFFLVVFEAMSALIRYLPIYYGRGINITTYHYWLGKSVGIEVDYRSWP